MRDMVWNTAPSKKKKKKLENEYNGESSRLSAKCNKDAKMQA
jgi:hypothetical protein